MTLREVLHAHIPFLHTQSSLRDAIDKMDIYQFPALVVVGSEQEVLGVLTEGDVCRAVQQSGQVGSLAKQPALKFATEQPVTADVTTEISDALQLMLMSGLTVLPVVEDDRLMGMVLRVDLLQAILTDLAAGSANATPSS
jgi:signal-transduction protein with cAMP-binding, CBS, and nucleotidyltransferase domain